MVVFRTDYEKRAHNVISINTQVNKPIRRMQKV